jgi:thiamine pyrophosphate-dependent acetolactate synthase large subunit-like protein
VAQIRGDMETVAQRLAASKIDAVTIGIQEDILVALEEMIAALQKAQRDLEKQKQEQQQQQQQQQQQSGEQPLVEQLAELRLIRTMETRIMSTTERYAKILAEAGDTSDVLPLVKDLAERQTNLYRITRDIVQKRNQ